MTFTNHKLKYLFTATFADGSVIEQDAQDKSTIDPEKRSQFFDVIDRTKKTKLVSFALKGEGHSYLVNLKDGHFEVDGVPFRMHEDSPALGFSVIFFRNHTHTFNCGRKGDEEVGHEVVYRIGWKANGREAYQRVLQID